MSGVRGSVGMPTFQEYRPGCKEGPFSGAFSQAQRSMNNIVGYRNDRDEDQENDERGEPPKACIGR